MDGVELIVSDYRMSISKTSPEVIRFQIRVVHEVRQRCACLE